MRILIASKAPKRREGGVAGIAYGVGRGLEQRGHSVEYLFDGDLPTSPWIPGRFNEIEFAFRLARLICRDPARYSVVNIHAPSGWVYGVMRYLFPELKKNGPAY